MSIKKFHSRLSEGKLAIGVITVCLLAYGIETWKALDGVNAEERLIEIGSLFDEHPCQVAYLLRFDSLHGYVTFPLEDVCLAFPDEQENYIPRTKRLRALKYAMRNCPSMVIAQCYSLISR